MSYKNGVHIIYNLKYMIEITLPDGNKKQFANPITGLELAQSIGAGLAKAALAVKINDDIADIRDQITESAKVSIITMKDPEGLEIIRHDTAHILAQAIKELYPETQITIGPVIENGFYYDIHRKHPFSSEDLNDLEKRMYEIVEANYPITKEIWSRNEAIQFFKKQKEFYKAEIIESIPESEYISMYRQGTFIDLCRGPHGSSTGVPKAFKLMKIAGAYWRGDSNNEMLQRIYGTAWPDKKQLNAYLTMLEEAERRDHRKLGKSLGLFHIQEEAVGQIFWHPNGWTLYRIIENYIRKKLKEQNYIEVKTPIMADRSLWERSGHWEKFRENMFIVELEEKKTLAIKPMNCPLHIQIFNQEIRSYRDLPIRMAEFGCCHRNEPSGSMHGLMRVRGFTQDDAHIFCLEEQITSETIQFTNLLLKIYRDFGFTDVRVKFSNRPEIRAGTDATWDKAEDSLLNALKATGLEYSINQGEGAFYGPKLEFVLKDAIGRDWQCGTLQLDFVLPERLDAHYIGTDGNKHRPVMIHRAILGSFERFIGILIEEYEGKFPLWLAPIQIIIATIVTDAKDYAIEIADKLKKIGARVETDLENTKISYKIRKHSLNKIPLIISIGRNEIENKTVSIRRIGSEKQDLINLNDFIEIFKEENVEPGAC
jgi:threonyl-tRNA synthetase